MCTKKKKKKKRIPNSRACYGKFCLHQIVSFAGCVYAIVSAVEIQATTLLD